MPFRLALAIGGLVLGLVAAGPAVAGPPSSEAAPEQNIWLKRLHEAATLKNYRGTLVMTTGGAVASARVAHFCDGSEQFERIESLDGPSRQVFRHNGVVHTLWPDDKVVVVEQRDAGASLPALLRARPEQRLFEHYDLTFKGYERVAGHEAQVALLQPRDGLRFAQKFWSDRRTGLLLRADLVAADGRVLESAAFSDVEIDVKPRVDHVLRQMKNIDGYRVIRPQVTPTALDREGWTVRDVPGFRQVSCVRRAGDPLQASEPRPASTDGMVQAVFSDGLTHVSLFIETYQPDRHKGSGGSVGATHTLMQRRDQWWITVMGDVPAATLARFADALQRQR